MTIFQMLMSWSQSSMTVAIAVSKVIYLLLKAMFSAGCLHVSVDGRSTVLPLTGTGEGEYWGFLILEIESPFCSLNF